MAIQGMRAVDTALTKIHPLDDLESWGKDFTYEPPMPKVKVDEWQKRFDRVFGRNKRNESIVKLVWSGDRRYWHKFFYDWDAYGKGTKVEERPLVLWKKIDLPNGDYVDLFPPRWMILMRIEPEQYAKQWKAESWVMDPNRGAFTVNPATGAPMRAGQMKQIRDDNPPSVFWEVWGVIGEHDAFCCEAFEGECFGAFRQPQDKDLETLHELRKAWESGHQSPYEALNPKTEAEIVSYVKEYYRQQYQKMPASVDLILETANDFLAPLVDFSGQSYTDREKKEIVKNAFNQMWEQRAEEYEQKLRRQ